MTNRPRRLAGLGALGLALGLAGCDGQSDGDVFGPSWGVGESGVVVTESRDVAGFSSVSVSGAARLIVERTGRESLTITAEDNILPHLTAELVGDHLVLGPRSGARISPTREILYRLNCRELSRILLSGATHAEAVGIDSEAFAAELSGASELTASGRADNQVVHASGASLFRAAGLASRAAVIGLSGASRATVRVSRRLVVDASGASVLEYIGDPELTVNTSGGSLVRQIGDE